MPQLTGPTFIRNGQIDPKLLDQSLREAYQRIRELEGRLAVNLPKTTPVSAKAPITPVTLPPAPVAGPTASPASPAVTLPAQPASSSGPQLAGQLSAAGQAPLNVQSLLGQLAQPQYPYLAKYSALPNLGQGDPQLQPFSAFVFNNQLYWVDASAGEPGVAVSLSGSSILAHGTRAAKPATATNNNLYFETDTGWLYLGIATAWNYVAGQDQDLRSVRQGMTMVAGDLGALWFEGDTMWIYRYNGASWAYKTGIYFATEAQRVALTISTDDNGATLYTTDFQQLWRVVSGAWALQTVQALVLKNFTAVSVNGIVTTPQNLQAITIPAKLLNQANKLVRVRGVGTYDELNGPASITWTLTLGGVALATWVPKTPNVTATNCPWQMEAYLLTTATGAAGTLEVHGTLEATDAAAAGQSTGVQLDLNTASSGAIDLTAAESLQVTIAFSSASASNVGRQRWLLIEELN